MSSSLRVVVSLSNSLADTVLIQSQGAGPSMGCITSVTLIAYKQTNEQVFWGTLLFPRNKTAEVAQAARDWHAKCDERESITIAVMQPDPNQEVSSSRYRSIRRHRLTNERRRSSFKSTSSTTEMRTPTNPSRGSVPSSTPVPRRSTRDSSASTSSTATW